MNLPIKALIICTLVPLALLSCGRGQRGTPCPGQLDPSTMSAREVKKLNIASVPQQAATELANVKEAEEKSRRFINDNYPHVIETGVGEGWGVNYTQDEFGKVTYHRTPDHMVVVVVAGRSDCPDPERGTLFVFGDSGLRVPVRFHYDE